MVIPPTSVHEPSPRRAMAQVSMSIPSGMPGGRVRRVLAAMALMALAVAALAAPTVVHAQILGEVDSTSVADREPRSFEHAKHRAVTCGVCHAVEQRHRSRRSWTAQDCAACHHGEDTPVGCTSCHERTDLAAPLRAATVMALSVWSDSRVRNLSFDHGLHGELGCLDCHQGGMTRPPETCESCHENHHRPDAECARCHVPPDPAIHDLAAHGSCGGSGCHSVEATARPMLSRTSCELCHQEQREHQPGRSCAQCHIPGRDHEPGARSDYHDRRIP